MREPLASLIAEQPAQEAEVSPSACLPLRVAASLLRDPLGAAAHALGLARTLGSVARGEQPVPMPNDRRFSDPQWQTHPLRRRAMQAWLAGGRHLHEWINSAQMPEQDRERLRFLADQLGDALAPSNSPLHPQVLQRLRDSRGASVLQGLSNLRHDLLHNRGLPTHVDRSTFEVGRNLAASPGSVVFRNEMLELIQYRPSGAQQYQRPLMIVPPQINRFYIFDLDPQRSLVRHALDAGFAVFMVSWRNPDSRHRHWGFSEYVEGLLEALDACLSISGSDSLNLAGACLGGLTCALLLNELARRGRLQQIASATYLVTPLDCRSDQPALLFLDPHKRERARLQSLQKGVLQGHELARLFAWLRPRDLIWHYWTHNYLLGESPQAFDVLYWNADNTRLPAVLHGQLLELIQHEHQAASLPLEVCGAQVDFARLDVDSFAVAGINDHITPWLGVYRSMRALGGRCQFILANGGHIQAILSPPGTPKAGYLQGPLDGLPAADWQSTANSAEGSWWPYWMAWLQTRSGELVAAAPTAGNGEYPIIEPAPGSYVRQA